MTRAGSFWLRNTGSNAGLTYNPYPQLIRFHHLTQTFCETFVTG